MGIESILGAVAAPVVSSVVGGIFGGSSGGSSQAGTTTTTQQNTLDPRIQSLLFGDGSSGNQGLLSQYQAMLGNKQGAGTSALGTAAQNLLSGSGAQGLQNAYNGYTNLSNSNIAAPTSTSSGYTSQGYNPTSATSNGYQAQGYTAPQAAGVAPVQAANAPVNTAGITWNTGESFSAPDALKAAQIGAPSAVQSNNAMASQVSAPAQNNLDLTGAYQNFISGNSGVNPYLNSALQAGVDVTNAAYQRNQSDATNALNSALGGIRGNSILTGQFGGTRQGIAEGNALKSYTQQLADANSALAAQNSANTTAQQAAAYNAGQDRALSATQGLGAQQYGVASQNSSQQQAANLANASAANQAALANQSAGLQASTTNAQLQQQAGLNNYAGNLTATQQSAANRQQANLANQAASNQTQQFNASQANNAAQNAAQLATSTGLTNAQLQQANNQFNANQLANAGQFNTGAANASNQFNTNAANNAALANAGYANTAGQFNAGAANAANQYNVGAANSSALANLQAQLGTNSLNSANQATGLSGLQSLLGNAYNYGTAQDNYALTNAQAVNNLIAPYVGVNSSSSSSTPYYTNTAANVLGGATAGLGLYNQLSNLGSGNSGGNYGSLSDLFGSSGGLSFWS